MTFPENAQIQVAGIRNLEEAQGLLDAGVDMLGWPFELDKNQEDLPREEAGQIIRELAIGSRSVLITYLQDAASTAWLLDLLGCEWVQLHGGFPVLELERLRALKPRLGIIYALVIGSAPFSEMLESMREREGLVDAWITDTLDPETGSRGATGLTHDWSLSRRLRDETSLPLVLAGGLRAENVAQGIFDVAPAAVDTHTGIEDNDGFKCARKTDAFVRAARMAFKLNAARETSLEKTG